MTWVPRSVWTDIAARGGNNPRNGPKSWARRPAVVIVHYVGSAGTLGMPRDPAATMRSIQTYGWNRDGAGIEYGAVTFPDGSTWGGFEGEVGAHCATTDPSTGRAWNYSAWGLCAYLGVGNATVPDPMMTGLADAIRHARRAGWLAPGPLEVIGHRDTGFPTSCPGPALYPRLGELAAAVNTPAGPGPAAPAPAAPPHQEHTVIVIARPAVGNARFLATSDARGFISAMTWIPDEAAMARLAPHYPTVDLEPGATRNIGLIGPVPTGDALYSWSAADFLNAS